jgi:deoxyribose-phosphate aldolase
MKLTAHDIARMIDASALKFDTSIEMVDKLIDACKTHDIGCAFVMPCYSEYLSKALKGTSTEFGTSLGFPSGQVTTAVKVQEAEYFMGLGADQVDMVMNVGWLKSGWHGQVAEDIKAVRKATEGTSLKVIIEAMLLTDEEITTACKIVMDCGSNFVKSGTGFSLPTNLHHVEVMKAAVGDGCHIKVAGGIRDLQTLIAMYELGAERFGIGLDASLKIINEAMLCPEGVEAKV